MMIMIITLFYPRQCYSTSVMELSKQLKQMIQIENSMVKNPNWLDAN